MIFIGPVTLLTAIIMDRMGEVDVEHWRAVEGRLPSDPVYRPRYRVVALSWQQNRDLPVWTEEEKAELDEALSRLPAEAGRLALDLLELNRTSQMRGEHTTRRSGRYLGEMESWFDLCLEKGVGPRREESPEGEEYFEPSHLPCPGPRWLEEAIYESDLRKNILHPRDFDSAPEGAREWLMDLWVPPSPLGHARAVQIVLWEMDE